MKQYSHLFSPVTIRGTTFKNRIVATPIQGPGITKAGAPTEKAVYYYGERARGGAAVITMGESPVNHTTAMRLGMTTDLTKPPLDTMDNFRRYLNAIHRHGALASIQLCHAGSQADARKLDSRHPISASGYTRPDGVIVEEMSEEQIHTTVQEFADCAATAAFIGFDIIQLHGGHGWLLNQFSSKLLNRRSDAYGGNVENRARFAIELLQAVRKSVGEKIILEYRLSADERLPGGNTIEDTVEFAQQIQAYVDIIQVSTGTHWEEHTCNYIFPLWFIPHGVNLEASAKIKSSVTDCLVSVVGGISEPAMAEEALAQRKCDLIGMCRPLVADPLWPQKAKSGREQDIVPCIRCIKCHDEMGNGGSFCTVNPLAMQELWQQELPAPMASRRVAVIGAGPAGMQAAITAAERGHKVVLFEETESLGGTLRFTAYSETKADLSRFVKFLTDRVQSLDIDVRLGLHATPDIVSEWEPDAVIAAIGAEQKILPVPVEPGIRVFQAPEAYMEMESLGSNVVIIGGKLTGVELAVDLAKSGRHITIVGRAREIAAGTSHFYRLGLEEELKQYKSAITCMAGTTCIAITKCGVLVQSSGADPITLQFDSIVCAIGAESRRNVAEHFRKSAPWFRAVGDCELTADVKRAVLSGYNAAITIT